MALVLIAFGGLLASGMVGPFTWREWTVALVVVLLLRPMVGWLSLAGTPLANRERWAVAVFGVRGVGSFYYLAFALNHEDFTEERSLWTVVSLVVVISILLHGLSAKPVMERLDRWRERVRPRGQEAS